MNIHLFGFLSAAYICMCVDVCLCIIHAYTSVKLWIFPFNEIFLKMYGDILCLPIKEKF